MVTFVELRDARLGALSEAGQSWQLFARQADELAGRVVAELTGPLRRSGWAGDAATAVLRRCSLLDDEVELAALQFRTVATVIGTAARRLRAVQLRLLSALDACALLGLRVDEVGVAVPPPAPDWQRHTGEGRAEWARQQDNARIYTDVIAAVVRDATEEDLRVMRVLDRVQPSVRGAMDAYEWTDAVGDARELAGLLGVDPAAIPAPGSDPRRVRAWWDGLDPDERRLWLTAWPERIGWLDGLPAADRDVANRLALRVRLADLAMAPSWDAAHERDQRRLTALRDRLETARYDPTAPPLLLLGVDDAGDGRAVVAVGNPDTARHTAVVVPGVGTELDDMPDQLDRARTIHQRADALTAGVSGDVAVVAWLGYDTPGADGSAVGYAHAQAGAPLLDRFVDGLAASHDTGPDAGPGHLTVIGHSYGSTVVGEALSSGDGLAVGDVITAGSPGMHAERVGEFRIDPRHVWAGQAADDPIAGWAGSVPGVHGNEPSDTDFGANRFHVDTSGHSDYWRPGSRSLNNQAAIVVGRYDLVTLDHGQAPR